MDKKNILIISLIALVLFHLFVFIPYLHRREATRAVLSAFKSWETGDMKYSFNVWKDYENSPPVYNLVLGKITKRMFDNKDGARHALIYAVLEFQPDNSFPSGKEWIFELSKTPLGWKIIDFHQVAE